jgi:hypothetical protein
MKGVGNRNRPNRGRKRTRYGPARPAREGPSRGPPIPRVALQWRHSVNEGITGSEIKGAGGLRRRPPVNSRCIYVDLLSLQEYDPYFLPPDLVPWTPVRPVGLRITGPHRRFAQSGLLNRKSARKANVGEKATVKVEGQNQEEE